MRRLPISALAFLVACGGGSAAPGIGDEPPATVTLGSGGAVEQAAFLIAAGSLARQAARREGAAPEVAVFAATVAADHRALDRMIHAAVDSLPEAEVPLQPPGSSSDFDWLAWQAALDSLLLVRLAEEPAPGLADGSLRTIIVQSLPTLAAHRQRALQLLGGGTPADSL